MSVSPPVTRHPRGPVAAGVSRGAPARHAAVLVRPAVAVVVVAALARAAAPLLGVAVAGTAAAPATPAALVAVPAALLVVAVVGLALRGGPAEARSAVVGVALLAPGALLVDLPLLVAPESAVRPDLLLPAGLAAAVPAVGAVVVLAADVLLLVAGVLAVLGARTAVHGSGAGAATAGDGASIGPWAPVAAAAVAALGLVLAPVGAPGGLLDPVPALDAPAPVGAGQGLAALATLLGAFVAAHLAAGRALLSGLAGGLAAGAVPLLVAGAATPGLTVAAGPVLVLVGAAGLAAAAAGRRRVGLGLRLPGAVGLVAAAATAAAATGGVLAVPGGIDLPGTADGSGALLLPAAVLLGVPALAALLGPARLVVRLRPTLGVAWLGVLVAAGPVLDVVLAGIDAGSGAPGLADAGASGLGAAGLGAAGTATGVATGPAGVVTVAPSGWAAVAAVGAAVLTGIVTLLAGAAERRDVDAGRVPPGRPPAALAGDGAGTAPGEPDRRMLPPAALAAVLAVPGLGGPLAADALGTGPGPWQDPGAAAWTALAGLVGVVVAVLLAPRARPARALALLGGAAIVVLVRLSALVLDPPVGGGGPGVGTWASGLCLLALAGAVVVAGTRALAGRRAGVSRASPGVAARPDGRR